MYIIHVSYEDQTITTATGYVVCDLKSIPDYDEKIKKAKRALARKQPDSNSSKQTKAKLMDTERRQKEFARTKGNEAANIIAYAIPEGEKALVVVHEPLKKAFGCNTEQLLWAAFCRSLKHKARNFGFSVRWDDTGTDLTVKGSLN